MQYIQEAKKFYKKYERYITPIAFGSGFVLDTLTLRRIDLFYENITFLWNLSLAAAVILLINAYDAGRIKGRFADRIIPFLPIVLQFSFGALFSAFIVFYVRSSSVFVSWPFLLLLVGLFIGNEFFRKRYVRLTFQLSIYFIALFSYCVFVLPVFVGQMSTLIYLASGAVALVIISLIVFVFSRIIPGRVEGNKRPLLLSIGAIYLAFQILYFTNVIPPIPLSLKEAGIYHAMKRASDGKHLYEVAYEPSRRHELLRETSGTFHWVSGSPIFSYSAVFAPTKIHTNIFHRWLYFDEQKGKWMEISKIQFPIVGGRDGGYRGYSVKYGVKPGKWRVDVINEKGQVLGRTNFRVVQVSALPELQTALR